VEVKSTPEISDALFISIHNVSTHHCNINCKLGISSIAELLKFASAFELIR
jgi:DNA-binding CsgD family transcriptional regulator